MNIISRANNYFANAISMKTYEYNKIMSPKGDI